MPTIVEMLKYIADAELIHMGKGKKKHPATYEELLADYEESSSKGAMSSSLTISNVMGLYLTAKDIVDGGVKTVVGKVDQPEGKGTPFLVEDELKFRRRSAASRLTTLRVFEGIFTGKGTPSNPLLGVDDE